MIPDDIASIRKEYRLRSLNERDVSSSPIDQFKTWWQQAISAKIDEPNAMTLATCDDAGKPSARIVLLKEITVEGFIFFTNYQSRKGKEIIENENVSLLFFWKEMERQVRVEGIAQKISAEKSDQYFASRPEASQVGAWASPQSQVIDSRDFLEKEEVAVKKKFHDKIPRPSYWGGFLVIPEKIEFWQGRPGRLHDRILYSLRKDQWHIERLAP